LSENVGISERRHQTALTAAAISTERRHQYQQAKGHRSKENERIWRNERNELGRHGHRRTAFKRENIGIG